MTKTEITHFKLPWAMLVKEMCESQSEGSQSHYDKYCDMDIASRNITKYHQISLYIDNLLTFCAALVLKLSYA